MSAALTRRAAFTGAFASVAVVGVAAATVVAPFASEAGRFEWDRLRARYEAARAVENQLLVEQDVQLTRWYAHRRDGAPAPQKPKAAPLDTSLSLAAIVALTDTPAWHAEWAAYEKAQANWQAADDASRVRFMADVESRVELATDTTDEALLAIKSYPVSSLTMLAEKAAVLKGHFGDDLEGGDADALIRDIARLAKLEGRA